MSPTDRIASHELAAARRELEDGRPTRCLMHLAHILALVPEHPEALARLDGVLAGTDDPRGITPFGTPAAQALQCRVLARVGDTARALDLLGWLLDAIPSLPLVELAATWLTELPADEQPRSRLGWMLARVASRLPDVARDREADLAALRRLRPLLDAVVEHAGDDASLLMIACSLYRKMRDHDRALELARRVAPRATAYDRAIGLANVHRLAGDTDAALTELAAAAAADPDAAIIRRDRALTLAEGERFAEAAIAFDELLAEDPDAGAYAVAAAWCRRRAGRPNPQRDDSFADFFERVAPDLDVDGIWRAAYEPWTGYLPEPGDAIVASMRQIGPGNDAVAIATTAPEAPSALWAARLHTGNPDVPVSTSRAPEPPIHPVAACGLGLFDLEYTPGPGSEGKTHWQLTRLEPAWPEPHPEARTAVHALAAEPHDVLPRWRERAAAIAASLGAVPIDQIVGCAAHVGDPPNDGWSVWQWLVRAQLATALVVAQCPGGPELLVRLALGPHDWMVSSAVVALTELALDEPAHLPTVRAALWARRASIGEGWCCFERALVEQARRLPDWTTTQRTAWDAPLDDDEPRAFVAARHREPTPAAREHAPGDRTASPETAARVEKILDAFTGVLTDDEVRRLQDAPLNEPAVGALDDATPGDLDAALRRFATALPTLDDPYQAGRLALLCGVLVERGGQPGLVGQALAERLRFDARIVARFLDHVAEPPADEDALWRHAEDHPAAVRAWLGARWLNMACMTTLCRDGQGRRRARALRGLRDDLRVVSPHLANGWYVHELLAACDDLEIVALAPWLGRGWRLRVEAVRNVDHLCALLEGELFDGALDDALRAVARAETWQVPDDLATRRLSWHPGYTVNGLGLATQPVPVLVDGAARLETLPTVDDAAVIVAQPASVELHWTPNRLTGLHQAHRPRVDVVAELSRDDIARWLERLNADD